MPTHQVCMCVSVRTHAMCGLGFVAQGDRYLCSTVSCILSKMQGHPRPHIRLSASLSLPVLPSGRTAKPPPMPFRWKGEPAKRTPINQYDNIKVFYPTRSLIMDAAWIGHKLTILHRGLNPRCSGQWTQNWHHNTIKSHQLPKESEEGILKYQ